MHKATCSECGQECEVPFKPEEGRDVFCKECFKKKKGF
ncbi:DNA-directed RNA polymerase [Candidatus Pacearchaeota archaeon RBG_13_36_9]|nr:MAG: DNA-directed RNA polymerase [Candidatus Pacearchaeota archaeon RBG_13_36_9]